MNAIQEFLLQQGIGLLVGLIMGAGLPMLIGWLRADSRKKLTDKDPSNDLAGKIEGGLADILDKNKEEIGKAIETVAKKKK